jgi:hypothetical protein
MERKLLQVCKPVTVHEIMGDMSANSNVSMTQFPQLSIIEPGRCNEYKLFSTVWDHIEEIEK